MDKQGRQKTRKTRGNSLNLKNIRSCLTRKAQIIGKLYRQYTRRHGNHEGIGQKNLEGPRKESGNNSKRSKDERQLREVIIQKAKEYGIEPALLLAICDIESSNIPQSARYEEGYKWTVDIDKHARRQNITYKTEKALQSMSWGLGHIMGATARFHGYNGFIPELAIPQIGLTWVCIHIKFLAKKYSDPTDLVAAYNAGSVKRDKDGNYTNKDHVDRFQKAYERYRRIQNVS